VRRVILAGASALALATVPVVAAEIEGRVVWSVANEGGSEIVAHDPERRLAYVVGGLTLDVLDAGTGERVRSVSLGEDRFEGVNSVAVSGDVVAVSATAAQRTDPGAVLFYRAGNLRLLGEVAVGAVPDAVVFTPDGQRLLVANEGEPSADYAIDPEGSVSVIEVATRTERRVGFAGLNGRRDALRRSGVRIFGPNATVAQDLEPESIATDGREAYVTLQENNALAIIDLRGDRPRLDRVVPLGFKNHGRDRDALDVSDEDGDAGNFETYPNLLGVYQPDGIALARIGGRSYLLTANEGDAREYDTFAEEARVEDLNVAPRFPRDELARLKVSTTLGRDASGVYRNLYAFGGRSFSVRDTDGRLLFDSGAAIERVLAERFPERLDDTRSDDKGPEPENVVVGAIGSRTFAFVGLERSNAVIVFDVSAPRRPTFAGLLAREGDVGPEGLDLVPASESPSGKPLLLVANEVSSTTTAFELEPVARWPRRARRGGVGPYLACT